MHPGSNIAPTAIKKITVPTTSFNATTTEAVVPTTTTSTTTSIVKSDIPTESTIPTEYHTTNLVLPTLRLSIKTFSNVSIIFHTITNIHYIITNHQIVPAQQSLLALKYNILVATTSKLFDHGDIISSKSQSRCFSLPPDLRSEAWGVSVFPVFPRIPKPPIA
jgi:hypothetical protein